MKTKYFWFLSLAAALLFTASVVAEEKKKPEDKQPSAASPISQPIAPSSAQAASTKNTPIALTVEAIQELESRKKALDQRERELDERLRGLETQEKILKEKLRRMEELNKKMAEKLDSFKVDHDQRVVKLVTVVETMKPQAAAEYVENLDPDLAVEILARIQVPKAAKILNLVDKKKSAKLTELYTGYRQSMDGDSSAPANIPQPTKEAGDLKKL